MVRDVAVTPFGGRDRGHELSSWIERRVLDVCGEPVGVVADIYVDSASRRPAWMAIDTGAFDTPTVIAPIRGASLLGEIVVIAHHRRTVTSVPAVDVTVTLEPTHERLLSHYYARAAQAAASPSGRKLT